MNPTTKPKKLFNLDDWIRPGIPTRFQDPEENLAEDVAELTAALSTAAPVHPVSPMYSPTSPRYDPSQNYHENKACLEDIMPPLKLSRCSAVL